MYKATHCKSLAVMHWLLLLKVNKKIDWKIKK